MVALYIFFCSMSFIRVNQEFVVDTDATVNNTGEDIMGKTSENTVPLKEQQEI